MIWSYTDLLILVPMLGRAHTIGPLLESVRKSTPGAHVLWLCTDGDDEVLAELQGRAADLMPWSRSSAPMPAGIRARRRVIRLIR